MGGENGGDWRRRAQTLAGPVQQPAAYANYTGFDLAGCPRWFDVLSFAWVHAFLPELRRILLTGGNSGKSVFEAAVSALQAASPHLASAGMAASARGASHRVAKRPAPTTLPAVSHLRPGRSWRSVRALRARAAWRQERSATRSFSMPGCKYAGAQEAAAHPPGLRAQRSASTHLASAARQLLTHAGGGTLASPCGQPLGSA